MTRTRIIWQQNGLNFTGGGAVRRLADLARANLLLVPTGRNWKTAIELEQMLRRNGVVGPKDKLVIVREPRKIAAKKSRYRQLTGTHLETLAPDVRLRTMPIPRKPKKPSRAIKLLEDDILAWCAEEDF